MENENNCMKNNCGYCDCQRKTTVIITAGTTATTVIMNIVVVAVVAVVAVDDIADVFTVASSNTFITARMSPRTAH